MDRVTDEKNLLLLVQLRWLAVIGQVVTILIVHYWFRIELPLTEMALVIAFLIGLNLASLLRRRQLDSVSNTELFLALLLDVAALTMQLYLSGGAANPFISLYLLQVTLGAVLLEAWSTWTLVIVTSACFVGLTKFYRDIFMSRGYGGDFASLHIQGMFVCFVLSATLLVLFITRINGNLRARDARLASLRQQSAEEDHIVRMGLLASGAAHELGTPLATLSVILNDWQHMPDIADAPELSQELSEMQLQVERCKTIVSRILISSGEARGEGTIRTTVNAFFDDLAAEWRTNRSPARFDYVNTFGSDEPIVSDTALKQVIFNLFDNALECSPQIVKVDVRRADEDIVVAVNDGGPGFSDDMLAAFGKPYRSSKGRPGGGLGLFLVVNVVRKLGGSVTARNSEDGGAVVTLTLPLASLSP
ncbi:MAG: HAMP domain-containing histidine kinase [Bradyrhizobiaceae bacterium]|nr:MAG: HAMP domain-containing histidine kinase [Bradyrhizobiaceae bacterium]